MTKNEKTPRSGDMSDGFQRAIANTSSKEADKEADVANITPHSLVSDHSSSENIPEVSNSITSLWLLI